MIDYKLKELLIKAKATAPWGREFIKRGKLDLLLYNWWFNTEDDIHEYISIPKTYDAYKVVDALLEEINADLGTDFTNTIKENDTSNYLVEYSGWPYDDTVFVMSDENYSHKYLGIGLLWKPVIGFTTPDEANAFIKNLPFDDLSQDYYCRGRDIPNESDFKVVLITPEMRETIGTMAKANIYHHGSLLGKYFIPIDSIRSIPDDHIKRIFE